MPIAFRAAGAVASGDNLATFTLAAPAGTVSTDIVLAVHVFETGGSLSTIPAGWTLVKSINDATSGHLEVYRGLGSATFGDWGPNNCGAQAGFTLGYTGVDNTTPMDAVGVGQANASSTTATATSITTVTNNAWLVGCFGTKDTLAGTTPTWSGEFGTARQNGGFRGSVTTVGVDAADAVQASAGASGTKTATISKSLPNIGILVALRPADGGGGGGGADQGPLVKANYRPGGMGPRMRRAFAQRYPDSPVTPVELTQSPAAPFRPGRGPGMGPMLLRRNIVWPSATYTPDVTLALTGVQATGSVGTLGVQHDQALTGNAATGAAGTLTPGTSLALTGVAGTGSVGTLAPSTDVGMTGVVGTASAGTLAPSTALGMTGVAGTASAGTLAPSTTVTLTGNEATVTIGTLAPGVTGADVTIALTGVSASALIGNLSPSGTDAPADTVAAGTTAGSGGGKLRQLERRIRGPYSDPRIYEEYIKRCIAEREAPRQNVEAAVLKESLIDEVEQRRGFDYAERDALLRENLILERLLALAKAKRDTTALMARQRQIHEQIEALEQQEMGALLALFDEMGD